MKKCELLQQKAKEEGLPPYMYQPYHEPLMPKSAWEVLPSHYEAHVEEKNAKVRALMREMSECEAFVFFADALIASITACLLIKSSITRPFPSAEYRLFLSAYPTHNSLM